MAFKRKHVLEAIKRIRANGIPAGNRESTKWDLVDPLTHEKFPPKAITRIAQSLVGEGIEKCPSGGPATNDPLRKLGFQIVRKHEDVEIDSNFLEDIDSLIKSNLDNTTRDRLIEARLGQGKFRLALLKRWNKKCPIT